MIKLLHTSLILIFVCAIVSCEKTDLKTHSLMYNSKQGLGKINVLKYQNGAITQKLSVDPTDTDLRRRIESWIASADDGQWKHPFTSYAPVLLLSTDTFNLNFIPNKIILNYKMKSGKWNQVEREMNSKDRELQKIILKRVTPHEASFRPDRADRTLG